DVLYLLGAFQEPLLGALGIGERFLRRKGLGGDDEKCSLRAQVLDGLRQVSAVHIRHKMNVEARLPVWLEGFGDHDGSEVGAADADVDDVGDGLASVALPGAAADRLREFPHM